MESPAPQSVAALAIATIQFKYGKLSHAKAVPAPTMESPAPQSVAALAIAKIHFRYGRLSLVI